MVFNNIKNSLIVKTMSIVLIFAFSLYNVSYAITEPIMSAPDVSMASQSLSVDDIGIAIDAGTIKSTYTGDTGKMVIHIQDAHCNFEAQSNINKMLDQLTKEHGVNVISVEGAEGLVDTAWFKAFPDAEIRKEVATYFMKKGEITGAEYFSINSDYKGTIFGAETKDYYVKNLKAFTEVYPYKSIIENYFISTRTVASRLKLIVYPPNLSNLDAKITAFEEKQIELSEFAEYLFATAKKNKIDLSAYPNLKKLIETLEYEQKIDFDIVDSERTKYIDLLAKKLSKEEMTGLVTQSIQFKKGHIKAVNFYSFLRDLAKEHNIPMLQEYPNLFYYYIYTKIYDGIDNEGLFREIDQVERDLKNKMYTDDLQRKLDRYSELVEMFIDLANIELTNEDYDLFTEYSNEFSINDVITFYGSLVDKYNLNYSIGSVPPQVEENIPKMITFYEVAMKRDTALIDNTLSYMEKGGNNRCVLIAGGFHTRGIKSILEGKGISYVVVTPKITKDVDTPYIKVLTNQRTSLEDIITESAAMPGTEMITSKEKITEGVSDLLAPVLRTASGTDFGPASKEAQDRFAGDWTAGNSIMWIEKVHKNLVDKLGMTQNQADAKFSEFVQNDQLWDMLLAVYTGKYADNAKKLGSELDDATRKLISDEFSEYRNTLRNTSPGMQAASVIVAAWEVDEVEELAGSFQEAFAAAEVDIYDEEEISELAQHFADVWASIGITFEDVGNTDTKALAVVSWMVDQGLPPTIDRTLVEEIIVNPGLWETGFMVNRILRFFSEDEYGQKEPVAALDLITRLASYMEDNTGTALYKEEEIIAMLDAASAIAGDIQEYGIEMLEKYIAADMPNEDTYTQKKPGWADAAGATDREAVELKYIDEVVQYHLNSFKWGTPVAAPKRSAEKRQLIFEIVKEDLRERNLWTKVVASGLTPGQQAAGGRVLTTKAEHDAFNEVVRKKFDERDRMTDAEKSVHAVPMDHIRKGFVAQLHDGYAESLAIAKYIDEDGKEVMGLPVNVHPSRGGEEFEHRLIQLNIDRAIYESLSQEERDMLARHELAHIDISNGNEQSEAWKLWVNAGKPVGEAQEDFVNKVLGYDVTEIARKMDAMAAKREKVARAKYGNVEDLEGIVENDEGPTEVIAITNGGDGNIVERMFSSLKNFIFRKDGTTTVMAHEEVTRRGQFLGLLDAMKAWKEKHGDFDRNSVSLGIMMPGKGTRLSPLTLSLFGIKPFITMLIKARNKILSGATASLYTWNLVANNLKRMGFRGIAWKWGDEPQIAANRLSELNMDLNGTDIVRFGSTVLVTDDLAENKEWLSAKEDGTLGAQVRRRGRSDLLKALGVEDTADAKAMVHIGSPAFSYDFIDAATEAFGGVSQESWLDVDGYLIEALTLKRDSELTDEERADGIRTWDSEMAEEDRVGATGMKEVLDNVPDFYERAQELKRILNEKRGKPADTPLNIKVVDFGEELAWYDVGQLSKARESFYGVNRDTPEGEFARRFAGMEDAEMDEFGNRIVGECYYPKDGSVRNSTLINTRIFGNDINVDGAVMVDSDLGNVTAGKESVVYGATVANLEMGERSFSFNSVQENLKIESDDVHTSMPANSLDLEEIKEKGLEGWAAKTVDEEGKDINVGKGAFYNEPAFGNPRSFNEQRERMRARSDEVSIEAIEKTINVYVREPLLSKIMEDADMKKYLTETVVPLKFGTSGLRDTVDHYEAGEFLRGKMTDQEVYINTRGFIAFLREIGDINTERTIIAVGGDLRSSTRTIQAAVIKAIEDEGLEADFIGDVPSPTLAYYAMEKGIPSVMVTGSHIPEDRNGIKYTKISGEVLKSDEKPILDNVQAVREQVYEDASSPDFQFDLEGKFHEPVVTPPDVNNTIAVDQFVQRYAQGLPANFLEGRTVVIYQHSAVGRDIAEQIFKVLGAEVIVPQETVSISYIDEATGKSITEEVSLRSDTFVPVDTEKITNKTQAVLNYLRDNYEADAYISFDGDTDRPLFTDENANFLPGDKLGALSAQFLKPDMVAIPVSANRKMVEDDLINNAGIDVKKTKVGSPHVIARVEKYLALPGNEDKRAVTWEANGGFLLMTPVDIEGANETLKPLPTRDAMLPLILALQQSGNYATTSEMIKDRLTPYETNAGVVDNKTPGAETYTAEMGQTIKGMFTPTDTNIAEVQFAILGSDIAVLDMDEEPYEVSSESKDEILKIRAEISKYFTEEIGFTAPISAINFMDGVQIVFDDGTTYEVSHLRPSSNAPEFRNYALGENITKAREIAERRYKIVPAIIEGLASAPTEGTEGESDIVKTTPGIYAATPEITRADTLKVPLVQGPVIMGTEEVEYTVSVVLSEDDAGEATIHYEIETFVDTEVTIPAIIGEALKGRQVQLRVAEGAVSFDEETIQPDETYTLNVKPDYQTYNIRNANKGERAVMIIEQKNNQREKAAAGILSLVKKHLEAIKEQRMTVYVPSEMFYEGSDVGSFKWTKDIIKAFVGDKIQLKNYQAIAGLGQLGNMGLDTSEDMVNILIAANSQLTDPAEFENQDVKDFVENVRPLPIPVGALNFEGAWDKNGWDFSFEAVGWALILGAVTKQNIIDLRNKADETSPAADMVKFMEHVLNMEVNPDDLFALMPYNELTALLDDITSEELKQIIEAGGLMEWLSFLAVKFLFDMKIEPFDPTDQLRQTMKTMWSV